MTLKKLSKLWKNYKEAVWKVQKARWELVDYVLGEKHSTEKTESRLFLANIEVGKGLFQPMTEMEKAIEPHFGLAARKEAEK